MTSKDAAHRIIQEIKRVAKQLDGCPTREEYRNIGKIPCSEIEKEFGSWRSALEAAGVKEKIEIIPPKVLVFDIETAPIMAQVWDIWDQNVGLNQIVKDWHILSWAAKWLSDSEDKVMYMSQEKAKSIEDDTEILKGIWALLDEADFVITQNGKSFDHKKLNARFVMKGLQPPSSYRHIDIKIIAKRHFAFTSNRLEYMTDKLNTKYKKLKHEKFSGFELWRECLLGNKAAWKEMEKYNKHDVLALEELYKKLIPWDNSINFNVTHDSTETVCKCGSLEFVKNGHSYTSTGRYARFRCKLCGSELRSKENELSKEKRSSLKAHTTR